MVVPEIGSNLRSDDNVTLKGKKNHLCTDAPHRKTVDELFHCFLDPDFFLALACTQAHNVTLLKYDTV